MSEPEGDVVAEDREAADWLARLRARSVSAETLEAFRLWRSAPRNAAAYQRMEAIWKKTGALGADPEIAAITREILARPRPRARRAAVVTGLAVIGAVLAVAVAVSLWPGRSVYTTAIGEQKDVRLADGSHIHLDTATRLRIDYSNQQRLVVLEAGQALFDVAHDPRRPFRVQAGQTEVTALGTRFDVRRAASGVEVVLVQGSVAVTDETGPTRRAWRLTPGQQLRTLKPQARPEPVDAVMATSWTEGRLIFKNTPLSEAVAEINRYLPRGVVLEPGAPASVAVNGSFKAGDREAFVAAAVDLFDLEARTAPDGSVRLSARPAPSAN